MNISGGALGTNKKKSKAVFWLLVTVVLALLVGSTYKMAIEPRYEAWLVKKGIASSTVTGLTDGSVTVGGKTPEQAAQVSLEGQGCNGGTGVTNTYNDQDLILQGTNPGTDMNILTDGKGRVADSGTISLTPGKEYKALAGNGSATYYAKLISFTAGCSNQDVVVKLPKVATLTLSVLNNNGVTLNSGSNKQSIGQNDCQDMTIRYDANSNADWGNRNIVDEKGEVVDKNVVVFGYSKSDLRSIRVTNQGATTGTKPNVYSFNLLNALTYNGDATYVVEGLQAGEAKDLEISVCSVTTGDPGAGNFTANFYDANQFVDTIDGVVGEGFQDSANVNRFLSNTNVTILYN